MGDLGAAVSAADQSASASGPGGGEGGASVSVDAGGPLNGTVMTFTANDAASMGTALTAAASALAAKAGFGWTSAVLAGAAGALSTMHPSDIRDALQDLGHDMSTTFGLAVVNDPSQAISISAPAVVIGPNSFGLTVFSQPVYGPSGSESNM
jgi:hypothetical protein